MQHPYTIIIPHFVTGKMTAYAIHKILEHSIGRDIKIIIVDNGNQAGLEYLLPFRKDITIIFYPTDRMQSHGLAFDYALDNGYVKTEYFITLESDSFPKADGWLEYYDKLVDQGYDAAGSLLALSGGVFLHPTGAIYKKSVYFEAKKYIDSIDYAYYPNIAMKEGFGCHLMVRSDLIFNFMLNPKLYVELHSSYKDAYDMDSLMDKVDEYLPIAKSVFHNGMGDSQEAFSTYRHRNIYTEPAHIILTGEDDLIYRMGAEPGQFLCYWMIAMGKKLHYIPTSIKWLPGRQDQQQEYTLMENGVCHLWGVTAYNGCGAAELQDIIDFKSKQMNALYESMPESVKIRKEVVV